MARTPKKKTEEQSASGFSLFDDKAAAAVDEEDLPRDEAGRRKIKQQYIDLLGIRIEKLKGRILNRERINKTLEGIRGVGRGRRKRAEFVFLVFTSSKGGKGRQGCESCARRGDCESSQSYQG